MKKDDKKTEMVSLNEGFFSLEPGNLAVEELERRIELAIAAMPDFVCGRFHCVVFDSCNEFTCGTFTEPKPDIKG